MPLTDTEIANIEKLVEQSRLTEVVIQQNGKRAIFSSRETAPKLAKPFAIVAPQTGTITFESLEIDQAVESLRATSSGFASDLAILNTRADFTSDQVNTLQTGADKLTNADLNEEAANQLSLQVRGQLSITGLNIANQSQGAILDLF